MGKYHLLKAIHFSTHNKLMQSIHHIIQSRTKYLGYSSKLCEKSTKANTENINWHTMLTSGLGFGAPGEITSNKLNQYGLLHLFMYASQLQHSYMDIQNFIKD